MKLKKWGILLVFVGLLFLAAGGETSKIRRYLTTGGWYPDTGPELQKTVDQHLEKAKLLELPGKIKGIIAPHAGFSYSGDCAANAYKQLQNPRLAGHIQRVILLGVSHRSRFYGAAVSGFDFNSTPLGNIPVDREIIEKLLKEKHFILDNNAMQQEHSLENQLPFLQRALKGKTFKIVPILFGSLRQNEYKNMAKIIRKHVDDNTLVVVSTDLTHYGRNFGYTPFDDNLKENLTLLDQGIIDEITRLDIKGYLEYKIKTAITMCGYTPVGVMIQMFNPKKHTVTLADYYKSGDRNNDYKHSVSYASFVITEGKPGPAKKKTAKIDKKPAMTSNTEKNEGENTPFALNKKEQKALLEIARKTLDMYLGKGKEFQLPDLEKKYPISGNLKKSTGVFVTLRKKGHLRGCIGSIVGVAPLYVGVRDNAVKAAVRDYRFPPVKKDELKKLDIEISVMTPLQKIEDYKKIRLGTDGVILGQGSHRAVYLPQVATETGWNLDKFLGNLCRKAGLPSDTYKESRDMEFYIFQAQVFGEKE